MIRLAPLIIACCIGVPVVARAASSASNSFNEAQARSSSLQALQLGYLPSTNLVARQLWQETPMSERNALISRLLLWVRDYTASSDFQQAYTTLRNNLRPQAPLSSNSDWLEQRRQQYAAIRAQAAALPAEQRQLVEEALRQAQGNPDKAQTPAQVQQLQQREQQEAEARYQKLLLAWQEQFPENPQNLLLRRLDEFIGTCSNVDFKAHLQTDARGRLVFSNPQLERKPLLWKTCFRVGAEGVNTALPLARDWREALRNASIKAP